MKKFVSLAIAIVFMLSLMLDCSALYISETPPTENINTGTVSYKGTIEDLPEYIQDSYNSNEKAESIDIYDEDPFSLTTNNSDGTKTVEIFQTPIKYIENQEIIFIDINLKKTSVFDKISSKYIYESTKAPVKSFFPAQLEDGITISDNVHEIKCYPNTENSKFSLENIFALSNFDKPTLNDENVLKYEEVFSENDAVSYTPISNGVKEEIIIEEYDGNNIYVFTIKLKDLKPLYLKGDSIPLIDKLTGEEVAAISQIDMRDSSQGNSFNTSLFNKIELTMIEEDIYTLKIILDEDFLSAESTVYPVIVDPTITFNADPIYDAPVFSKYPSTNFNANTYNVVGYHGSSYGEGLAFIKINNIQNYTYINPNNITSAYLKLYEGSGKTNTSIIEVYNTKSTWSNTSITYSNMPALKDSPYSTTTITNSGWYNFNIKGFIKIWLNSAIKDGGMSQNYGLALKMSTTGVSSRQFASANNSTYPPSIVINYTEDTSLTSGNYIIRSQYNPDSVSWNYLYADTSASNVIQYKANGNNYQIWNVKYIGNGYYELYSKASSSKAVGVESTTPSNGTNIGLYTSSANNRIKFRIIKNADGSYRILSYCGNKNMSLDVSGPSDVSGANIQSKQYSGNDQQRWNFYKAAPCGYLNYWHFVNETKISHQANSNIKVYITKDSDFNKLESTIKSYVKNALDEWSPLGYTYTFVDSPSECNIYVKGISRETATAIDPQSFSAIGMTKCIGYDGTTATYEGQAFSPSGWKSVYSTTKRTVYLIWDTTDDRTVKTSNLSSTEWKAVVTHEIGHALGHEGHTDKISVMLGSLANINGANAYSPNTINFEQMLQVY